MKAKDNVSDFNLKNTKCGALIYLANWISSFLILFLF